MDTSNLRITTTNLADSIETDIMSRHSQVLQVISQLYSDMLDLVLESNDLAKIFHIKAKLESIDYSKSISQADIDYMSILQIKLNSLNTNLDPTC